MLHVILVPGSLTKLLSQRSAYFVKQRYKLHYEPDNVATEQFLRQIELRNTLHCIWTWTNKWISRKSIPTDPSRPSIYKIPNRRICNNIRRHCQITTGRTGRTEGRSDTAISDIQSFQIEFSPFSNIIIRGSFRIQSLCYLAVLLTQCNGA